MKISDFTISPYQIDFTHGLTRSGLILTMVNGEGQTAWSEASPLLHWSKETLEEAKAQLEQKKEEICSINWSEENCLHNLHALQLLPSVLFGIESGILSLLSPLTGYQAAVSALLLGTPREILSQAEKSYAEGYTSAKLKVGHLPLDIAKAIIMELKDTFRLRIDVNRAWSTQESLRFFSQFPLDAFDYVEEPFQNPEELALFPHPLAIDESFPGNLSLKQLETLPTLKALIYKPTIQGGMTTFCLCIKQWLEQNRIQCILSSSFESDIGLTHIASMAHRLSIHLELGIGTHGFRKREQSSLQITQGIFSYDQAAYSQCCRSFIF
ncbi:MAG: o-succinylbenzoate synthase [Chlamydiales bacterium]|nr:o-succinylbenzoate synthase [Chlamydiales bacterium]